MSKVEVERKPELVGKRRALVLIEDRIGHYPEFRDFFSRTFDLARRDRRRRCCSSLSLCVFGQLVSFAQSGGACARRQQDQRASALAHPLQGPQEGLLQLFASHRGSCGVAPIHGRLRAC